MPGLKSLGLLACVFLVFFVGIVRPESVESEELNSSNGAMEQIVVGGGCFWCMEAVFQSFRGVEKVESGFAGGHLDDPHYYDVVNGDTGHAESVRVTFDPKVISLKQILTIFFHAHDPTTKDRQGNDVGSQYRSIILYANEDQHAAAEQVKLEISESKLWNKPLVTEIVPLTKFYVADQSHQNYYKNNPNKPYCLLVVGPKVQKIKTEFRELLK